MKLCVIGDARSPHVCSRAAAMLPLGNDITVVSERPSGGVLPACGITEIALGGVHGLSDPKGGALCRLWQAVRVLRAFPSEITHIHFAKGNLPCLAYVVGRRPLIISTMGADVLLDERAPMPAHQRFLTLLLLRRADLVTTKSDHMTRAAIALGVDPQRIMKVVWGIDTQHFRPHPVASLREHLGIPKDAPVVFSPRSLRPFYNIALLLEAFALIRGSVPTAHMVIAEGAADLAYKAELKTRVDALGLSASVHFIGAIRHPEMPDFYNMSTVVLSAAPSDGVPQSLLECLACGTPMVLTQLDQYREVVEEKQGVLYSKLDAESFASAATSILVDSNLRGSLSTAGRAVIAERYSLSREAQRVQEAYRRVVAEYHPSRIDFFWRVLAAFFLACEILGSMPRAFSRTIGRVLHYWQGTRT